MGAVDLDLEDALDGALAMSNLTAVVSWRVDGKDCSGRWDRIVRVVCIIRRHQRRDPWDEAEIGFHEIAKQAHCSANTVRKLLGGRDGEGGLWRTLRVVERVDTGVGSAASVWRLRHPSEWRKVPWLEKDKELRRLRLGFATWDSDDFNEASVEHEDATEKVNAGTARQTDFAYQRRDRATNTRPDAVSRAKRRGFRATTKRSVARKQGGIDTQNAPTEAPPPPYGVEADASPPKSPEQEQEEVFHARLVRAIEARGNGDVNGQQLHGRIRKIVRVAIEKGIPCEDLERWAALAPSEKKSPMAIGWVEKIAVDDQRHLVGAQAGEQSVRAVLERRIAELRAEIDLGERTGGAAPTLWDDLAACENELAAIKEGDT